MRWRSSLLYSSYIPAAFTDIFGVFLVYVLRILEPEDLQQSLSGAESDMCFLLYMRKHTSN